MDITKKIATLIDVGSLSRAIAQVWDLRGLSRDLGIALAERIGKQKDVVVEAIAREFTQFLRKIDIAKEMQKILEGMTLKISTTIDFERKTDRKTPKKASDGNLQKRKIPQRP